MSTVIIIFQSLILHLRILLNPLPRFRNESSLISPFIFDVYKLTFSELITFKSK